MLMDIFLLVVGFVLLVGGGEALVRGAVGLAVRLKITPAVIGLTVVSAGTSMPELVTSLVANLGGQPDVAVGNVIGSNIFNIALILGLTSLVLALPVTQKAIKIEWPILLVITLFCVGLMGNGVIGRIEGLVFVALLVGFVWAMIALARQDVNAQVEGLDEIEAARGQSLLVAWVFVVLGCVLLPLGGKFVVDGAVSLAARIGVSERVIGLTAVALGTSLPELASSLVAAARGRSDIAVGNIIGSNIFNLLAILGTVAMVRPIPVDARFFQSDVWWMVGFTVLLAPLLFFGRKVTRIDGIILLIGLTLYMFFLWRSGATIQN